jgi:hypothetical protein
VSYDVGQTYRAILLCTDAAGAPVNPATATLKVSAPPDITAAPATLTLAGGQLTNPAVGTLYNDWPLATAGLHKFAWTTTGPGIAQTDYVNARQFVSVISLAEARNWLNVADTRLDPVLRLLMGVATRAAERVCGTLVPRQFTDDFVDGTYKTVIRLPHGPALSSSSVTSVKSIYAPLGGPTWAASDLYVNAAAGTVRLASQLDFWYGPWLATYTGGRAEIPEDTIQGVKEILYDLWATQRGVLADTDIPDLATAEQFEQLAAQVAGAGSATGGYRIPPRALAYLQAEQAPGFA